MKEIYPQVTVLMSVYNSEKYVAAAIESILAQSFTDFEFLLYDDCSTDSSLEILKKYASIDDRIILVANPINRGLTATLVEGMNNARGKYLARMDADDICYPERLLKQVTYLNEHQEISLLGSSVLFFDDHGYEFAGYQPVEHNEIKVELLLGYTMMHPSVMMRLNDFKKYNLNYDVSFRYSQDFDLWVRAVALLKFANIKEPLLKMREHPNKISRELKPQQKVLSDRIRNNQLVSLKIEFSEEEITAFHLRCSQTSLVDFAQMKNYESILQKILNKNKTSKDFDSYVLNKKIQQLFIGYCIDELGAGNKIGLYFWKSSFLKTSYSNPLLMVRITIRTFLFIFKTK
jgi:glycosyltransferase involved in cell wall biosynthesis